ncbi:2-amino-4-hydroxy-6-hydroxymethyldihydropteridine diphosphokinase [Vagococcus penaei]|uniref:2-amino-4-hydroxy-6-hydroxymethyldihydropteridine diphosphokinase n=1 Tax=Vagococcus penaei TaxID=633807 RepID=A0A1Q2D456_9ENTE|nr:2-amino-4-hydroxy-6-hydroxymethyldihydropteridine diphosphokinase [Vagococcus penaei]AQP53166.1 2-amino-4-hydroxy-6-hydroxymethyldihydropteridine diphosphokinase [Vagococcus penaei]RSU00968.1 2-amino-4-hydroxy-6-hydroxymethyldihydropteridine diphosphokinase [Vagococcus penaei]
MKAYLALGSNLDNRLDYLKQAVILLNAVPGIQVQKKAKIYETDPYGPVPQDNYLNSVIEITTDLSPDVLLEKIHVIEATLGRERTIRWGPRTIDIDILWISGVTLTTDRLIIPHKELTKRSFVLIPLQDIFSEEQLLGKTLETWITESGNADEVRKTDESW